MSRAAPTAARAASSPRPGTSATASPLPPRPEALLEALDRPYISGLTLLGGEPFEPDNQRALLPFLHRLRQQLPDKTVWAFSGYTWEELTGQSRARCEATGALLSLVDVLVDGEFVEALRDISLRFRGSSNQRLLDVPASLAAGRPIPWEG